VKSKFGNDQTLGSGVFLRSELSRCGLIQYFEILVRNGFEAWKTVLDIREEDLEAMGFKLGHRRILQRHITNYCSHTELVQSPTLSFDNKHTKTKCTERARPLGKVTKRLYNRCPKRDNNALTKPKSGYVLSRNHTVHQTYLATVKEKGKRQSSMSEEKVSGIKKESASSNKVRQSS
jgi:CobQ-like glutamine amidotransferase family enzyme